MRFDDRLATVLSQPAAEPHDMAVRWRQLVDLVARSAGQGDEALIGRALEIIRGDAESIDERLRAATARAIAGPPVPIALLEVFASDGLAAAAPLLAAASLDDEGFARVRAAASDEVRQFLDTLRPPKPPAAEAPPPPAEPRAPPEQPPPRTEPVPSIGEVVARIERLRSSREQARETAPAPPRPSRSTSLFRWECNPSGEIDWVQGAPRGPLVGRSIATADPDEGVDDCVERSFGVRAPFRDCVLELGEDGPLAGRWVISGVPGFSPADGRFIGYRGVARREAPEPEASARLTAAANGAASEHEALREMIHEIKTPLNAIIGFAEIIDGQYFGPAHSRYRARAAEIVTNARSLLEAAEDLDFAARLQSARDRPGEGTDFASFFPPFADDLRSRAARHGVLIDIDAPEKGGRCTLEPELTERLLRRFTDAVLSAAAPGEHLTVRFHRFDHSCGVSITRPKSTLLAGKDDLLNPEFTIGESDRAMLGLGFSLRLVNGLVGIAGGGLDITPEQFALHVPMMD